IFVLPWCFTAVGRVAENCISLCAGSIYTPASNKLLPSAGKASEEGVGATEDNNSAIAITSVCSLDEDSCGANSSQPIDTRAAAALTMLCGNQRRNIFFAPTGPCLQIWNGWKGPPEFLFRKSASNPCEPF